MDTKKAEIEIKKLHDSGLSFNYGFDYNILLARTHNTRNQRNGLVLDGVSARQRMEQVGTMFRNIDENVWVSVVKRKISSQSTNTRIVITDCRYDNEIDAIRKLGGEVVVVYKTPNDLIITPGDRKSHGSRWKFLEHIKTTDTYIKNDSDLDNLRSLALNIMDKKRLIT